MSPNILHRAIRGASGSPLQNSAVLLSKLESPCEHSLSLKLIKLRLDQMQARKIGETKPRKEKMGCMRLGTVEETL